LVTLSDCVAEADADVSDDGESDVVTEVLMETDAESDGPSGESVTDFEKLPSNDGLKLPVGVAEDDGDGLISALAECDRDGEDSSDGVPTVSEGVTVPDGVMDSVGDALPVRDRVMDKVNVPVIELVTGGVISRIVWVTVTVADVDGNGESDAVGVLERLGEDDELGESLGEMGNDGVAERVTEGPETVTSLVGLADAVGVTDAVRLCESRVPDLVMEPEAEAWLLRADMVTDSEGVVVGLHDDVTDDVTELPSVVDVDGVRVPRDGVRVPDGDTDPTALVVGVTETTLEELRLLEA
jgi:hypothetical protein